MAAAKIHRVPVGRVGFHGVRPEGLLRRKPNCSNVVSSSIVLVLVLALVLENRRKIEEEDDDEHEHELQN